MYFLKELLKKSVSSVVIRRLNVFFATFSARTSTFNEEAILTEYVGLGGANSVDQSKYIQFRSVTTALRNNFKTQNVITAKENVDLTSYILLCLNNHNFRSFVDFIYFVHWKGSDLYSIYGSFSYHVTEQKTRSPKTTAKPCDHNNVYCFFITSRGPFKCSEKQFLSDWTLFLCKNFLLFQEISVVADHVGENVKCKDYDWPYSHQRRIIRLRRVIRWIIRVKQIIRLNLKMEWSSF